MTELVAITALNEIADLSGTAANIKFVILDLDEGAAADQTKVAPLTLLDGHYQAVSTALLIANDLSDLNNQQTALDTITAVSGATNEHVLTKDTATGNAVFKASAGGGGSSLPVVDETAIVYKTGTPASTLTFDVDAYTAARIVTWPDAAMTVAGLEVANVFTAAQKIDIGSTTAFIIEDDGTKDDVLVVDTTNGVVGVGKQPASNRILHLARTTCILDIESTNKFCSVNLVSNTDGTDQEWSFGNFGQTNFQVRDQVSNARPLLLQAGIVRTYSVVADDDGVAIGHLSPTVMLHVIDETATTNAIVNVQTIGLNTTGTGAVGLGPGLLFTAESSTTADQNAGRLTYEWATATHASRKALSKWTVFDTAEREGIRIEASGTAPMIGVLGATAVVRQDITGSRGGNAALADLLTKLATFGWITDSTT